MILKGSVKLGQLRPQMVLACLVIESVFQRVAGLDAVITSGNDSMHAGQPIVADDTQDPHYTGRACDFRIKHVPEPIRAGLVNEIKTALTEEFDVLWESQDTDNEHVHVQYRGTL